MMRNVITAFAVSLLIGAMLALNTGLAGAGQVAGDFLTGGGFIFTTGGNTPLGNHQLARANFGIGGGVKNADWWGHLNYIDHGNGLHVRGTDTEAYVITPGTADSGNPRQPHGSRDICGPATTNHPLYPEVFFRVTAADNSEPGLNDNFIIRLYVFGPVGSVLVYTTQGSEGATDDDTLGGTGPGGGNINLHAHNPSNIAPAEPPDCAGP